MTALRFDTVLDAPYDAVEDAARAIRAMGFDGAFTLESSRDTFFPLSLRFAGRGWLRPNPPSPFPKREGGAGQSPFASPLPSEASSPPSLRGKGVGGLGS